LILPRRPEVAVLETLTNAEIEDRYYLQGRMEVLGLLHDLIHRREHLNVRFGGGADDFMMTVLLDARADDGLIFDIASLDHINKRLLDAKNCIFVGAPDGVRVQFSTGPVVRVSWGGQDAFQVTLPRRAIRLQRRESFRVLTPVVHPLMARAYDESGAVRSEWPVHDISVGGVGLTVGLESGLEAGQRLSKLTLDLADAGRIECGVTVRHVTERSRAASGVKVRAGLRFDGLPRVFDVAIQRYVVHVEHERRRLVAGG
jgi:c-di-GMP-binding flagellar brake protein YcgR